MSTRARRLLAVVLAATVGLVVLGWDRAQLMTGWGLPSRAGEPMLVVAHRGDMERLPEDTAEAVWQAADLGANGIELDVHQSADGTWWVIHDATVDRTTDGSGSVHELTDDQMASISIDGGPGFDPADARTFRPPTLDAVLEGLADYEGHLIFDIQHSIRADPVDLARRLAGRSASIICRSPEDVRQVEATDAAIGTLLRIDRLEGSTLPDMLLLEAVTEATIGALPDLDRPVATYVGDQFWYVPQDAALRRAWAAGVHMFLAKQLESGLALRDELEAARP